MEVGEVKDPKSVERGRQVGHPDIEHAPFDPLGLEEPPREAGSRGDHSTPDDTGRCGPLKSYSCSARIRPWASATARRTSSLVPGAAPFPDGSEATSERRREEISAAAAAAAERDDEELLPHSRLDRLELVDDGRHRDDVALEPKLGLLEPCRHSDQLREVEDRHLKALPGLRLELLLPGVE